VLAADFDDEHHVWRVQTDPGGGVTARFLISASGVLTVPNLARHRRCGLLRQHHHAYRAVGYTQDLTGKRVAVIGTGASAVQVIPEIAPIVKHLTVFQRIPIWCFPKFDVPLPAPVCWAMRSPGGKIVQRLVSHAFV
jgi:cation diffusion facilitator CzcD-associated flavoprotein CzcO